MVRPAGGRAGRENGVYVWVPLRLARECPRCQAPRGGPCVRVVSGTGERIRMKNTHAERRKKR